MTFTNSGGFENYFKQETLDIMGDLLVLPKEK
jgi:hypothetical protein